MCRAGVCGVVAGVNGERSLGTCAEQELVAFQGKGYVLIHVVKKGGRQDIDGLCVTKMNAWKT